MTYLPKTPYYIGVDVEKSTLKIAALRRTKKAWRVTQLKEVPLTAPVKPMDHFPPGGKVGSAISSKEVFIRSLELPLKREKELRSALEFQASNHLPYPVEQAILDVQICQQEEGKTKLNLIAVRKDHLQKHLNWCESHQIYPTVVTSPAFALAALARALTPSQQPQLLIYVGESETYCCLVASHGCVLKSHAFSSALSLATEIQKVILALSQGGKAYAFDTIVLLGKVSEETLHLIQETTGKTTLFPSSLTLALSQEKLTQYGLAIGIALASIKGVNFRKKEFAPKLALQQLRAPLLFFAGSLLLFTFLFGIFGNLSIAKQKRSIQKQFDALSMQEGIPLQSLSRVEQYQQQLQQLRKQIEARPDTFALQPMIPTVSEFLGWFIQHPMLSSEKEIKIHSLRYTMVKHPCLSQPKERYQVKISMELQIGNAQTSKLLHEALLQDQLYIDHKSELQWVVGKEGVVQLSFFLKDKTRYT